MKTTTFFLLISILLGCGADKTGDLLDAADEIDFESEPDKPVDCSVPLFGSRWKERVHGARIFYIYDEGVPIPPEESTDPDPRNATEGEWEWDGALCKYKVKIGRFNYYDPSYKVNFAYEGEGFSDACVDLTGYYSMKKDCQTVTVCRQDVCESFKYDG